MTSQVVQKSSWSILSSKSNQETPLDSLERLKTKPEGSIQFPDTGLYGGLEHLKIETRVIDERFASVMTECVTLK